MDATPSNRDLPSGAEVRAILAALLVEKDELRKASDSEAAEAIGRAIDYWRTVLARTSEVDRQLTHRR